MTSWGRDIGIIHHFKLVSAAQPGTDVEIGTDGGLECRGLLIETAGQLSVTMQNGQDHDNLPFITGLTPAKFKTVRGTDSTAGTKASGVWAVY